MTRGHARAILALAIGLTFAACGARTALIADFTEPADASSDVSMRDGSIDRQPDIIPPIDSPRKDQVVVLDCPDAADTRVYLFTEQDELYSFYPPTLAFKKIGNIACAGAMGSPDSMGVDRKGTAYGVVTSGQLVRMSTANASCMTTPYAPNQLGWTTFGMAYDSLPDGGEALFVTDHTGAISKGLGIIDTSSFKVGFIGPFQPALTRCELTGTGDGRLFAFCIDSNVSGSVLAEVDPTNAKVLGQDKLAVGDPSNGYAVAFWGGDFWIFTSTQSSTDVTKYDPGTKTLSLQTTLAATVVGAGVSTCAPQ